MNIVNWKTSLYSLALLLSCTALADESETREASGFHTITVGGGISLLVSRGDHYKVTVSSDGDPDEVETEVSGDTLRIHNTEHWFWAFKMINQFNHDHYSVEVVLPELEKVVSSGGSRVKFDDGFTADRLKLVASGGSRMRFNGKLGMLDLHTSGGAGIDLAGSVGSFIVDASGGSHTDAQELEAKKADITTSGGSSVVLDVHDELTVRASGGSSVHYSGDPQHKDIDSSRSARVRAVHEKTLSRE